MRSLRARVVLGAVAAVAVAIAVSGAILVSTFSAREHRDLELTRREFELLRFFMHHPDEVVDRRRLHEEVWGYDFDPGTNVADVFVGYLRRKLEAGGEPRVLHTVRGIGFVLRS